MGKCIKIATRSTNSNFVHELGIAAADLEERYKANEVGSIPLAICLRPSGLMPYPLGCLYIWNFQLLPALRGAKPIW